MNFLEFIFKLLWQFINFEQGRFSELKDKAMAWRTRVMGEAETLPESEKSWYHKLLKYDNEWWFQLGMAVFFLFAFKAVRQWLMSDPMSGDDDDDDDLAADGEDEVRNKKAVNLSLAQWKF